MGGLLRKIYGTSVIIFVWFLCSPGLRASTNFEPGGSTTFDLRPDYFIAKDDPAFSAYNLDVSLWMNPVSNSNWYYLGHQEYKGFGWFRYEINLHKDIAGRELGIVAPYSYGEMHYYYNGVWVYSTRNPSPENAVTQRPAPLTHINLPGHLNREGRNVLAIRTHGLDGMGGFRYVPRIGYAKNTFTLFISRLIFDIAIISIFIFLSFFFGAYYFTQKQKHYLYFAYYTACMALWYVCEEGIILFYLDDYAIHVFGTFTGGIPMASFCILFMHSFFEIPMNRFSKALAVYIIAFLPVLYIDYFYENVTTIFHNYFYHPLMLGVFMSLIYLVGLNIKAIRLKKNQSKIMLLGLSFLCAAVLHLEYTEFIVARGFFQFIPLGYFGMVIVFAAVLRSNYAQVYNELQVAYKDLKSLDRLKDIFLANTSHELRTPLQAIIGLVDNIIVKSKTSQSLITEKFISQLNLIGYSARRLSTLVNDILDLSKIKENDIRLNKESIKLAPQIQKLTALSQNLIQEKPVKIITKVPGNLVVQADRERLQQILFNIVGNAIKFTEKGKITISAKKTADQVEVNIEDTGIGISTSKLRNIFDPFVSGGDTDDRKHEGAGLGLAITKELIEKHGGRIHVESEKGRGSKFTIVLPAGDIDKVAGDDEGVIDYPVNSESLIPRRSHEIPRDEYVLLVDDDKIILSILADALEAAQIQGICAYNGKNALEYIDGPNKPALVVLDIMMPDISGIELCKIIRKKYSHADMPILMFTAKTQFKDLTQAINAGASDFLTKPVDNAEFAIRLKNLMKISRAENEKREHLKKQRDEIFNDLHDHLGGFLTDMQLNVNALTNNKNTDKGVLLELKQTVDKTMKIFKERLNYIEDLAMISKNFLSGLRQILLRRYVNAGRILNFNAKNELYDKIMGEDYSIIRPELFSVITEIVTNDLKYGQDKASWFFVEESGKLNVRVETTTSYNPLKNKTGSGTYSILQRLSMIHGNINIEHEENVLSIFIDIPLKAQKLNTLRQ